MHTESKLYSVSFVAFCKREYSNNIFSISKKQNMILLNSFNTNTHTPVSDGVFVLKLFSLDVLHTPLSCHTLVIKTVFYKTLQKRIMSPSTSTCYDKGVILLFTKCYDAEVILPFTKCNDMVVVVWEWYFFLQNATKQRSDISFYKMLRNKRSD